MNDGGPFVERLGALDPVGLDELAATAELQVRFEDKYLVPRRDLVDLIDRLVAMTPSLRVLEVDDAREQRYRSCYYDTPDLELYRAHVQGRRRRYKARIRRYGDAGTIVFEIKLKDGRGRTVKQRWPDLHDDGGPELGDEALGALAASLTSYEGVPCPPSMIRSATITYRRSTLLLTAAHGVERVTIDRSLRFETPGGAADLGRHHAVVEVKSPGPVSASASTLHALGHRSVRASKYALAISATRTEAHGNDWQRLIDKLRAG